MGAIERFEELKRMSTLRDDSALLALFDSLDAVACDQILGKWRGRGIDTGHWLLPTLADMRWYGKWFLSEDDVKPLVCTDSYGNLYSNMLLNGEATLRMIDFRGKVSAAVVYDGVPMFGHLRRVNRETLLGMVDGKVLPTGEQVVRDGRHQFYYLEHIEGWPAPFVETSAAANIWAEISL